MRRDSRERSRGFATGRMDSSARKDIRDVGQRPAAARKDSREGHQRQVGRTTTNRDQGVSNSPTWKREGRDGSRRAPSDRGYDRYNSPGQGNDRDRSRRVGKVYYDQEHVGPFSRNAHSRDGSGQRAMASNNRQENAAGRFSDERADPSPVHGERQDAAVLAGMVKGSSSEAYTSASVVDGVPRTDQRQTWRAEICLPRPGSMRGERGAICIRGPNRFTENEASEDMELCKKEAEKTNGDATAVRRLVTRLKTDFEKQKHIDSGHGGN